MKLQLHLNYFKKTLKLLPIIALAAFIGCSSTEDDEIIIDAPQSNVSARSAGDVISLKANINSRYLSHENGGNMTTNRPEVGDWEKFTLVSTNTTGYFALKAYNGKYVSVQSNDRIKANSSNQNSTNSKFRFVTQNGREGLQCKNGDFMCAENAGSGLTVVNRPSVDTWEHFIVGGASGSSSSGDFDFGGAFVIETADNCDSDTDHGTTEEAGSDFSNDHSYDNFKYFDEAGDYLILKSCSRDQKRTEFKMTSGYGFSLSDDNTMSYTAKFEDYPSAGVTIAQLHCRGGAQRPFIRVEIDNGKIKLVKSNSPVSGSGQDNLSQNQSYSEGDYLDLEIDVDSDVVRIKVTTNTTKTYAFGANYSNNYDIPSAWLSSSYDNDFYFKAGVYNDSGNGSDNPKATFSSFNY